MSYHDIECPYCAKGQEINHDDGYGYEEGVTHQQQCVECYKYFTYTTAISFSYDAQKADCLNEGEHHWTPTITQPKYFTKMRCTMCDEERTPTEQERIDHEIPLTYDWSN